MMSARRTQSTREQWRDEEEDYYARRSRKGAKSSRDYRISSPSYEKRKTASELEVKSARRELNGTTSSRNSRQPHYEGRDQQERKRGKLSASVSPHRDSRTHKDSLYSTELGEDRKSYRHKHTKESSAYAKRRRSRSPSPGRGYHRKQPRIQSRSPYRSESLARNRHIRPRTRSPSAERSPERSRRSRKRERTETAVHYRSERSHSPHRPRRAGSPGSRQDPSKHRYRARSPPDRRLRSPKPDSSPRHHSYGKSQRISRRSSPADKRLGGERRYREEPHLPHHPEGSRRSSRRDRYRSRSPLDNHPLTGDTVSRSRRESVERPRAGRGAEKSKHTSPLPSRHSSTNRYRENLKANSRGQSPSASSTKRDETMHGAFGRSYHSSRSKGSPAFRKDGAPPPPSPPRPIPSFTDIEERGRIEEDSHLREAFPMHGMKASEIHGSSRPMARPTIDTRRTYSSSPQYMTPTSSHHVSPQPVSPYGNGRAWGQQQSAYHGQPT